MLSHEDSSLFQDLHELITVTYGLPDWASYTIFGLTTVLTGLFLGMVSYFIFLFVQMKSMWYLMWPCLLAGLFYLLYYSISLSPYILFWVLVTIKIGKTGILFLGRNLFRKLQLTAYPKDLWTVSNPEIFCRLSM